MKKRTKIVLLTFCMILLVSVSVLSTIAFLKSSDSVENTFTVGKVKITLDEAKVDEYGTVVGQTRVKTNTYKLIPGHQYTKDPVVHFLADSEASYLFVKVENGLSAIETGTTIEEQILANGWTKLEGQTGVYYKLVEATTVDVDYPVFETFQVSTEADVSLYAEAKIVVKAYAIQADGFTSPTVAYSEVTK